MGLIAGPLKHEPNVLAFTKLLTADVYELVRKPAGEMMADMVGTRDRIGAQRREVQARSIVFIFAELGEWILREAQLVVWVLVGSVQTYTKLYQTLAHRWTVSK